MCTQQSAPVQSWICKCGGLFCISTLSTSQRECPGPQVLTFMRLLVPELGLLPASGGWMLTPVKAQSSDMKGKVVMESKENTQSRAYGQIWSEMCHVWLTQCLFHT